MQGPANTTAVQEQVQKQKVTVNGAAFGSWLTSLLIWGSIVALLLIGVGILLWFASGLVGRLIDIGVLVGLVFCLACFVVSWLIGLWLDLKQKALNSNMIVTPHASVYFLDMERYINFTEQIAAAANQAQPLDEKPAPEWIPPTFEQRSDQGIFEAHEAGETWENIAEKFHTTVSKARTAYKRHFEALKGGKVYY